MGAACRLDMQNLPQLPMGVKDMDRGVPSIHVYSQVRVLFYVDQLKGNDYITPALTSRGHSVTIAKSKEELIDRIKKMCILPREDGTLVAVTPFDLVVVLNQSDYYGYGLPIEWMPLFSDLIRAGCRVILADWSEEPGYGKLMNAIYTADWNQESMNFGDSVLVEGMTSPVPIINPGWGVRWAMGMRPINDGVSLGSFPNGDSCLVLGNGGRSVILGFLADALPAEHGKKFFGNLVDFLLSTMPVSRTYWELYEGESSLKTFTVSSRGDTDLLLAKISIAGKEAYDFALCTDNCSDRPIKPGASAVFEVLVKGDTPGPKEAVVSIPSNDPKNPVVVVRLAALVIPSGKIKVWIASFPSNLKVYVGISERLSVRVANVGRLLKIGRLSLSGQDAADFSIEKDCSGAELGRDQDVTVEIMFSPNSPGHKRVLLSIPSSDKEMPVFELKLDDCIGYAPGMPIILINSPHIDIGEKELGKSHLIAGIINIPFKTTATLVIGKIEVSGKDASEFVITNDDCSGKEVKPPAIGCPFFMEFRPKSKGRKEAVVSIPSNDPYNPVVEMKVTGTGK